MLARLRARKEWQFFAVLPKADRTLAIGWWTAVVLRGVLPAVFAIAMGVLVSAVQHGESLALGLAGASAIVTLGTLLARIRWLNFRRFSGQHSIVIYLAFFLPMASTRTLLLRTSLIHDIGTVSLVVTVAGVVGALAIWRAALAAKANFLFERPAAFWIAPKKAGSVLQAAE